MGFDQPYPDECDQLTRLSRLLHLADSSLPIGGTPHSYGLEGLVADGLVTRHDLGAYLISYLEETGYMEARCCRIAYRIGRRSAPLSETWSWLNHTLSAMQAARELRDCSIALGHRFLLLVARVEDDPLLAAAAQSNPPPHYPAAFGLVSGRLGLGRLEAVTAYLHSMAASILAAGQRLLQLGEMHVAEILWSLKPVIARLAKQRGAVASFTPAIDIGSMHHAYHQQRLFIS